MRRLTRMTEEIVSDLAANAAGLPLFAAVERIASSVADAGEVVLSAAERQSALPLPGGRLTSMLCRVSQVGGQIVGSGIAGMVVGGHRALTGGAAPRTASRMIEG